LYVNHASHGSHLLSHSYSFLYCKSARHFLNIGGIKALPSPPPHFFRGTIPPVPPKSPPWLCFEQLVSSRLRYFGDRVFAPCSAEWSRFISGADDGFCVVVGAERAIRHVRSAARLQSTAALIRLQQTAQAAHAHRYQSFRGCEENQVAVEKSHFASSSRPQAIHGYKLRYSRQCENRQQQDVISKSTN